MTTFLTIIITAIVSFVAGFISGLKNAGSSKIQKIVK